MKKIVAAVVAVLALAGCTSATDGNVVKQAQGSYVSTNIVESKVTLSDGRTIVCLTYKDSLSCDWNKK